MQNRIKLNYSLRHRIARWFLGVNEQTMASLIVILQLTSMPQAERLEISRTPSGEIQIDYSEKA